MTAATSPESSSASLRKLQFVDDKSSKFWHASVDDTKVTVTFGRIGTNGQTQEKSFASAEAARKAFDKQVAEKLAKGYVDEAGGDAAPASPAPAKGTAAKKTAKAAEPPTVQPAPEPEAPSAPERPAQRPEVRIRITDADRRAALVDGVPPPTPRPEPRPFDREAFIARLERMIASPSALAGLDAANLDVPLDTSREEARLLLYLVVEGVHTPFVQRLERAKAALDSLKAGQLPAGTEKTHGHVQYCDAAVARLFLAGFGVPGLERLLFQLSPWTMGRARDVVARELVPYLSTDEREALRGMLLGRLTASDPEAWIVMLLGVLGEPPESLWKWIDAWRQRSGKPPLHAIEYSGNATLLALFALRDKDVIAREARYLHALPTTHAEARMLLAATELECLDLIVEATLAASTKAQAEGLAKALALVEAPECAPHMLRLLRESKAASVARRWLDENPELGASGAAPLALQRGPLRDEALDYLRSLAKRGLDDALDGAFAVLPPGDADELRRELARDDEVAISVVAQDELPAWARSCFGDPAKLVVEPVVLSEAERNPVVRIDIAPWNPPEPVRVPVTEPLPTAPPFDLEACLVRLRGLAHAYTYPTAAPQYSWNWHALDLRLPLSREEASFWHEAYYAIEWRTDPATAEQKLRAWAAAPTRRELRATESLEILAALYVLFGFAAIDAVVGEPYALHRFVQTVVDTIVRHLGPAERDALRAHLLELPRPSVGSTMLALRLGASKTEVAAAVRRMPRAERPYSSPELDLLPYLATPEEMVAEADRLGTRPLQAKDARTWLAATGLLGIPLIAKTFLVPYVDKASLLSALVAVRAPVVAPIVLSLRKNGTCKETARKWLEANVVFAIQGLLPLVGTKEKLANAAVDYLRELRRRGYGPLIAELSNGDATVEKLVLDPNAGLAKPSAADRALAPLLPPILLQTGNGTRKLGDEQVAIVLAELRSCSLGAPTARLLLLRENADRMSLDRFAWALCQGWLKDGAASKDRWRLEAVGQLGGDGAAIELAKLVRVWPGESQHARAVLGLECLRAIGTDTALMQIHGIAQKVAFKGIKERANECLDGIALDRGLGREELADRIIPDGGLDERGTRVFDFGPRSFTFVLGPDLKPMVRDATGKRLPDLPKPGAKDDAVVATASVAAWKLLKKQVAEVAKTQSARLELAMIVGRRWTPEEFEKLFLRHPVMVHLVRRLIWGAFDAEGKVARTFRVGDDGTFSDSSDEPTALGEGIATVGVLHPSHLSEAEKGTWGEVLSDYEIIPPFVQLGRPTYALTDEERKTSRLARFAEHDLDPKIFLFGLDALGWQREQPQDGGSFMLHTKTYGSLTAYVTYTPGAWVGTQGDDWSRQRIESLGFVLGKSEPSAYLGPDQGGSALKYEDVDPIVMSEALHDLTRLYERGKGQ